MESEGSLRCSQGATASGHVKHFLIYWCFALCACQSVVVKLKGYPLLNVRNRDAELSQLPSIPDSRLTCEQS